MFLYTSAPFSALVLLLVLPFLVLLLELARVFLLLSPIGETEISCHRFKGLCYLIEFERIKEADAGAYNALCAYFSATDCVFITRSVVRSLTLTERVEHFFF